MDKLRALHYFQKVAETSSFTRTGKYFSVPASSVSRRIQDLERSLGVELFRRSTRHVRLTELGTLYRDYTLGAMHTLSEADELLTQHAQLPGGVLKITAMPGYGSQRLLPALKKLRNKHPEIIVDVELTDQVFDLTTSQVDIAIRASAVLPERVIARRLSQHRFVLVATPEYLKTIGTPKLVEDLKLHKALFYRGPNGILKWHAHSGEYWSELNLDAAFVSNDGTAILEAAYDGLGIALVPEWGISQELSSGILQEIQLIDCVLSVSRAPDLGIYLIYNPPKYSLSKVKAVVEFLVADLSD